MPSATIADLRPAEPAGILRSLLGQKSVGFQGGRARIALVAALLVALAAAGPAAAGKQPTARFGIADDAGKYADDGGQAFFARLGSLGMTDNRITILWDPAQPGTIVEQAFLDRAVPAAAERGVRLVFHVYPAQPSGLTATPERPDQFARFLGQLAREYPQVREFVVGNEPNQPRFWQPQFKRGRGASAAAYAALLARSYDALKAVNPEITVIGLGLSGRGNDTPLARSNASTSPVRFLRDLGAAYRRSGRTEPLMDELGVHPYPRSDRDSASAGDRWPRAGIVNLGRVKQAFWDAFAGTGQPTVEDGLRLRIDEIGWQVAVPAARAGAYVGSESSRVTSERAQAANYVKLIQIAACDASISGLYLLHLQDDPDLERFQSGLLRADGSRRPAYAAVRAAVVRARRGCAGRRIVWRHATKVVGVRAAFGATAQSSWHKRRSWGFRVTAAEEARYRGAIYRAPATARTLARSLSTLRAPGALAMTTGRVRAGWSPTVSFKGLKLRPGRYVYAVQLRASMNVRRTKVLVSRAVSRSLVGLRLSVEIHDPVGVLLAARAHRARELVVAVRLRVAALLLERAAERVVRVVVGRGELEHGAELRLCLAPALNPEVRDPERLPDRGLRGLEALRLLERHGGLRRHPAVQVVAALLVEVVGVGHASFRYGKFSSTRSCGKVRSRVGPISIPATRSPASIAC